MTEHWNDFLEHKSGHKYIKRWWKNGRWNYQYPEYDKKSHDIDQSSHLADVSYKAARGLLEVYDKELETKADKRTYASLTGRSEPDNFADLPIYKNYPARSTERIVYEKAKKDLKKDRTYQGKVASASRRAGRAQQVATTNDSVYKDITHSKNPKDLAIKTFAAVKKKVKKGKKWISNLFK